MHDPIEPASTSISVEDAPVKDPVEDPVEPASTSISVEDTSVENPVEDPVESASTSTTSRLPPSQSACVTTCHPSVPMNIYPYPQIGQTTIANTIPRKRRTAEVARVLTATPYKDERIQKDSVNRMKEEKSDRLKESKETKKSMQNFKFPGKEEAHKNYKERKL